MASSISKFSQTANSPDKNIWLKVRTSLSRGKCLSGVQNSKTFFSVPRLCGSRQVVAHCRADERIVQVQLLCPALGSQKWRKDNYAVQCQVRPNRKPKKTKQKTTSKNYTNQTTQKPPTAKTEGGALTRSLQGGGGCLVLGSCNETAEGPQPSIPLGQRPGRRP